MDREIDAPQMRYRLDPELGFRIADPVDLDALPADVRAQLDADVADTLDWLRRNGGPLPGDR